MNEDSLYKGYQARGNLNFLGTEAKRGKCLEHPSTIFGEPELPGFVLELAKIWEPDF